MRTLIISDLHLGLRLETDVLRRPEPLGALLAALDGVDRLVLLGDAIELMEGRASRAAAVAEPVMRAIGGQLRPGAEVVVVPGNHDHPLVRQWVRAAPERLTTATHVPPDATPRLAAMVAWLAPAQVTVFYPGAWLRPDLWVTHGHYVDRHLIPTSSIGMSRKLLGRAPHGPATPADYERGRRPSLSRASQWLPRPVMSLLADGADLLRAATMPRIQRGLFRPGMSPFTSRMLGLQMRRASLPALASVVARLGVEADWVVFGHVHRLGPLAGDDPDVWRGRGERAPAILNCGSWLYEPRLVHRAQPPHPYWPGGAVEVIDDQPPRAVGLLDGLPAEAMR